MPSSSGMTGNTAAPSGTSSGVSSRDAAMSPSRDGGNDGQLVAILDGRGEVVQVADVLVVEEQVDEPAQDALIEQALRDAGVLRAQGVEDSLHGRAGQLDHGLSVGVLAHRRW